ncbi:MAG: ferrous iron transport protein A [Endomicrobium sp.]|jgi:Fe2+ transport system protein FeoA|nr:ferrous iron transport protein A [Endomicrobium sp.]
MRRVFYNVKNRFKYCFYDYWRRKLVKTNIKMRGQNKTLKKPQPPICDGLGRLSCAKRGVCKFVSTCCDEKLAHRLSEMGFTPGGDIKVVEELGRALRGSVMVEVKGSKLALSDKIANNIFIKEN